jgi:hypothetical protein
VSIVGPGLLDSADSDVFASKSRSRPQVCERASALSDRARSTSQRYCTAVYGLSGTGYCCRCGSAMGQWQGLVPALGPGVIAWSQSRIWCRAPRSGLTLLAAMDVLATFAVLRLSPGLKAIQDT